MSIDLYDLAGTTTPDGRYRFDGYVGEGSFGVVYRGHDTHLDHPVALKLYDDTDDDVEIDSVLDEARIHKLSAHENVVAIHDVRIEPPYPLVAMEFVKAGAVDQHMTAIGVPYADGVRWTRDALDALAHAHSLGVLHRDIKPGNLLLGRNGEALLSDFGLAEDTIHKRIASDKIYLDHAAPELYAYEPSSAQTDIWAMGVTLYRLVTGQLPFMRGDMVSILKANYTPPQTHNPQVTRCLTNIIRKALEPDPDQRYQEAREMLGDLTRCRAVASWLPATDPHALAAWEAQLPSGHTFMRILPAKSGVKLEVKTDRGAGTRRVGADRPYPSEAQARQAMAAIMRRTVQGYGVRA